MTIALKCIVAVFVVSVIEPPLKVIFWVTLSENELVLCINRSVLLYQFHGKISKCLFNIHFCCMTKWNTFNK